MSAPQKLSVRYAFDLPLGMGPQYRTLEEALEDREWVGVGYDLYKLYANEAGRVVHHEKIDVPA